MRTLIEVLAGLAILANAVIYGTDVFGAIVMRPAIAAVDDRTLTQLLGHIHRIADRLFPRSAPAARSLPWRRLRSPARAGTGRALQPQRSRRLPWSSSWRATTE